MKRLIYCLMVLLLVSTGGFAQYVKGVRFVDFKNWEEVVAMARMQNKMIFVDCYATWCGPCKQMDEKVFSLTETGALMNNKFINVRIQMDSTEMDNEHIKRWRTIGKKFQQAYSINSYPTYLFFSKNGKIIHKERGFSGPVQFYEKVVAATFPQAQYYTIKEQWQEHKLDSAYIYNALITASVAQDRDLMVSLNEAFAKAVKYPYLKENLEFLYRSSRVNWSTPIYGLYQKDKAKMVAALGQETVDDWAKNFAVNSVVWDNLDKVKNNEINWESIYSELGKYLTGEQVERIILEAKISRYSEKEHWDEKKYVEAFVKFIETFGHTLPALDINNRAYSFFKKTGNKGSLLKVASIIKVRLNKLDLTTSYDKASHFYMQDTYASLLYRGGKIKNAIEAQVKAVELAPKDRLAAETLDKMRKGEKTW